MVFIAFLSQNNGVLTITEVEIFFPLMKNLEVEMVISGLIRNFRQFSCVLIKIVYFYWDRFSASNFCHMVNIVDLSFARESFHKYS